MRWCETFCNITVNWNYCVMMVVYWSDRRRKVWIGGGQIEERTSGNNCELSWNSCRQRGSVRFNLINLTLMSIPQKSRGSGAQYLLSGDQSRDGRRNTHDKVRTTDGICQTALTVEESNILA